MFEALLAALKAIPLIVDGLKEVSKAVTYYHDSIMQKEFESRKAELNQYAVQLQNAKDKNEIAAIIRDLNSIKL